MAATSSAGRLRAGAAALITAGLLFVIYPALRPFSDEVTLAGAAAFASPAWLLSHMTAMVAFVLVAFGLYALFNAVQGKPQESLGYRASVLGLLGVGLLLPFYGAEAFGLHAIGQEALRQGSDSIMHLADVVRAGPGLLMFLAGLLLLAAAAIAAAMLVWESGASPKWSGVPFALGFALYIPQFFGTQPLRVAHGVLVAVGCVWIAATLWTQPGRH